MIYPYIVNKNGVWYPAGADVPEDNQNTKERNEQNKHTKTEINRMSTAELQELALENSVDGADEMTGKKQKNVLIEKFGL